MLLSIGILGLIWETGASVPAGRAYPAGFAGFFKTDTSWDWLPVAYGATSAGVTRTNYWYDISGNSWQTRAQGSTPARYDCAGTFATYSGEKHLFVFAGSGGSYPAGNTAFRYRYSTDTWTSITNFPYPAEGVMAAGEIGGMIYTFGGHNAPDQWTPPTVTTNTYRYSPSGNSYTARTAMPLARSEAGCAIARNENGDSCIYIISGIYAFDDLGFPLYTSRTDEYNPGSNSWRNRANFPGTPVNGASAATLRNEIYVMGGYNFDLGTNPTTIYIYNPIANSWVSGASHSPAVPDLPAGRDGGVATAPDFPLRRVSLVRPVNNDTCCNDTLFWRRGTGAVKIVYATGGDANNNVYTTTWRLRSVVQGYVLKYDTLPNFATASVVWNDMDGSGTDDRDTMQVLLSMTLFEDHWYYWTVGVVDDMPDTAWSADTFRFYYDCTPAYEGDEESPGDIKPSLADVLVRGPDAVLSFTTPWPGSYKLAVYDAAGRLALANEFLASCGRNQVPLVLKEPGVYLVFIEGQGAQLRARLLITGR
ncbi:MAG: hypothetical protein ABIN66_07615 [candidate division WOR-3 bacterium]